MFNSNTRVLEHVGAKLGRTEALHKLSSDTSGLDGPASEIIVCFCFFPTDLVQWKALSHQRQKFHLRQCKAYGVTRRPISARGNAQTHKVTYRNVEESRTCLTSFCNLSLNADLLLYFQASRQHMCYSMSLFCSYSVNDTIHDAPHLTPAILLMHE